MFHKFKKVAKHGSIDQLIMLFEIILTFCNVPATNFHFDKSWGLLSDWILRRCCDYNKREKKKDKRCATATYSACDQSDDGPSSFKTKIGIKCNTPRDSCFEGPKLHRLHAIIGLSLFFFFIILVLNLCFCSLVDYVIKVWFIRVLLGHDGHVCLSWLVIIDNFVLWAEALLIQFFLKKKKWF